MVKVKTRTEIAQRDDTNNDAEIKGLLKIGLEYICEKEDLVFLRKRK